MTDNNRLVRQCVSIIEPPPPPPPVKDSTDISPSILARIHAVRRIATRARIKIVVCADLTSFPRPGSYSTGMTGMHVARSAHMHAHADARRQVRGGFT